MSRWDIDPFISDSFLKEISSSPDGWNLEFLGFRCDAIIDDSKIFYELKFQEASLHDLFASLNKTKKSFKCEAKRFQKVVNDQCCWTWLQIIDSVSWTREQREQKCSEFFWKKSVDA